MLELLIKHINAFSGVLSKTICAFIGGEGRFSSMVTLLFSSANIRSAPVPVPIMFDQPPCTNRQREGREFWFVEEKMLFLDLPLLSVVVLWEALLVASL